ncbi:hypothetical protein ERICIV_02462 [Paenibacillus larvae subsp. larvae]|uniref:Uncharacterized protein n=2 Tax=Paenibacillus larvae TaxID=1464 RepID=A0A1U9YT68_9BACL|nr:hypothetical protein [Paenibacillus larvae]AQT83465.1 hypothetical protein B1222_01865 [Paenibacillus larvae subsp. pulvifaciens]AQZ48562.1 hypothetical protein B5S25_20275 [Paenibacillus larvae subsp. pulvifaciens]ARF70114.1 hypothetical protein B7C51_23095 [Paenibacillus larvae subsp. pulvifaciens]AVF26636.1 hypothetical protein ERICIII_02486 [Paenibacillus larvae subsp. larvae]AVF31370.1 hypothetical protein ERICIV_02462 [Paenibacillus larvae subsp. larvae]
MEKIDPYKVFSPVQVNAISCALISRVIEIESRIEFFENTHDEIQVNACRELLKATLETCEIFDLPVDGEK